MASVVDASRETEWGELAETILLFVNSACCSMIGCSHFLQSGLFAAVLTAFLVFTMTKLQAESSDISKDILLHISFQLSNSSVPPFVEPEFFVASHWAIVNGLLFASLALVLVDAYLAVLTRGWIRDFDQSWKSSNVPEERARKREMRLQGLKRWKLKWMVALLPLLIQSSLVLYFISLGLMLFILYPPIAYPTLAILAVGFCSHFSTTVISTLDTNAPFTSFESKVLHALIRWSRLKWRSWRTTGGATDDAKVELGGSKVHLAISNRLRGATSNAVENLPVLMEIFDQCMHTPSDWHKVLPLVQPYLSNGSRCENHTLRSVARLFLCSNSREFNTGREAVIKALGKHNAKKHSIEQWYFHLLNQQNTSWSGANDMIPTLEANKYTIVELRCLLYWIVFWSLKTNQAIPNEQHGVTFLCSTAVYIIQNRIVNDDHGLFDSLLLITQFIAKRSQNLDPNMALQVDPNRSDGELLDSVRNSCVPRESRWQFIRDLYRMSCTSAVGRNRSFRLLMVLLIISMNSAVVNLDIYKQVRFDLFTKPESDLPMLMNILWETWKSLDAERHLLIGIAARLLQRDVHKSPPTVQQSVQGLLDAYDSYISESTLLMTSNGLLFIEAILSFSLGEDSEWEPQTINLSNPWLVMHIHNTLRRGWCVPAESAIKEAVWGRLDPLGRPEWLDRWLKWLKQLDQLLKQGRPETLDKLSPSLHTRLLRLDMRLKQIDLRLKWLAQPSPLGPLLKRPGGLDLSNALLEQLNQLEPYLDRLNHLETYFDQLDQLKLLFTELSWLDRVDRENRVDEKVGESLDQQLDQLDQQLRQLEQQLDLDRQLRQSEQQRSTLLGTIAKSRLDLYNTKPPLRPDLVPLGLFLSPRNTDIYNESRHLILELFKVAPSMPPRSPPDTADPEVVDARALCSDFFNSTAIGDLTKWRLLSLVVFQEWGTIGEEWKDSLAREVLEVNRDDQHQRVDWMARVTPLLAEEFDLSEFMVAAGSNSDSDSAPTYGSLAPSHLRMVAIIVEHLGAERLTDQMANDLEGFLKKYPLIFWEGEVLGGIWAVIGQARARNSQSGIPLALADSDVKTDGPSHSP
jgi:hypothetical protein